MIDFHDWLRQIRGYCDLILDGSALSAAWVHRDYAQTSVTGFDELYEQIFDDLASDHMEKLMSQELPNDQQLQGAVKQFLAAIRDLDKELSKNVDVSGEEILSSQGWMRVREAAKHVRNGKHA